MNEKLCRAIVRERASGCCEICGQQRGDTMHHRLTRKYGPWDPTNMAADPGAFLGEVDGDDFQVAGKVLYPELPIVSHKTKGGMCCNGKRGCGGPGSYCCSKTVYTHRHDDGSSGPLSLPQSPDQVRWETP